MTGDVKKQTQDLKGPGEAYQAGRDIVVHSGLSADQMSEIMVSLARQLSVFVAEARSEQERRFGELRNSILDEFAREDGTTDTQAFKDPDFQYVVRAAHDSYARSGDERLKKELVRLIAERSTKSTNSRVARVINSAIEVAGKLSSAEYASLVTLFIIQRVVIQRATSEWIIENLKNLLAPFVNDLPSDDNSIEYLESLGCVSINRIASNSLVNMLSKPYAHAFGPGFTEQLLKDAMGGDTSLSMIGPRLYSNLKAPPAFWFVTGSEADLRVEFESMGIPESARARLLELRQSTEAQPDAVLEAFRKGISFMPKLEHFFGLKGVQSATVTIVGRALAHSALVGKAGISAPLEIWVK